MAAIEEILWNVFTYYSLNGNPRDPSRLHSSHLNKFCKDVMATDSTMTEHAITSPELYLIYTAALTNPNRNTFLANEKSDKIDFEAFLSCLIHIAQKCYPSCQSKEEAMQQFLMDNVLPLAPRRKPISIATSLKQPAIEAVYKYYEEALMELYKFYTTSSDKNRKGKHMVRTTSTLGSTFDDQIEQIQEAKKKLNQDASSSHKMSYNDFIRFATDFGLVTSLGVTSLDLGDIFLSVTSINNFTPNLRKMSFSEFWEGLVRCALIAFQDKPMLNTETKIKALFLSIWRHVQSSVQDHMNGYGTLQGGGFNTYKGSLLRGTQLLNDRFVAAWTKDDYRDYLAPLIAPAGAAAAANPAASSSASLKPAKGVKEKNPPASTFSPDSKSSGSILKGILSGKETKAKPLPEDATQEEREQAEALSDHHLKNLNHSSVSESNDFVVQVPVMGEEVMVRVQISEYEEWEDKRLSPQDMRQLLFTRPDITLMLYDIMLEEGLVEGNKEGDGEGEREGEGGEEEGVGVMRKIKSQKPFQSMLDEEDEGEDVGERVEEEEEEEKVETYVEE